MRRRRHRPRVRPRHRKGSCSRSAEELGQAGGKRGSPLVVDVPAAASPMCASSAPPGRTVTLARVADRSRVVSPGRMRRSASYRACRSAPNPGAGLRGSAAERAPPADALAGSELEDGDRQRGGRAKGCSTTMLCPEAVALPYRRSAIRSPRPATRVEGRAVEDFQV